MAIGDGAATSVLEREEADDEMPLVRDCSCRGDSGFAHLSCLTTYAEQKSKRAGEEDMNMGHFLSRGEFATIVSRISKVSWRLIYHLHLYLLPRRPTATKETASMID